MEEKKKRISELTELLNRAAYAYEQEAPISLRSPTRG